MAESPLEHADGPLRVSISCGGLDQPALPLISVTVGHAFNAIPWARLEMADGDMPEQRFPLSDGALFEPGSEIVVKAGYGDAEQAIFSGIVVRHGLRISAQNDSRLVVECRAPACNMALGRQTVCHVNQRDDELLPALIGRAGLSADVAETAITHRQLVQHDCSDWDFMLARAHALGLLVHVDGPQVRVKAPTDSGSAALKLSWGVDLMAFEADLDAQGQAMAAPAGVRGRMSFQGSALARPGALVELSGLGSRFSGQVLLSAVTHEISAGNWISRAEFGLAPQAPAPRADVAAPPRGGLLPGLRGLQIGVVLQRDGDPAGEQRVLVSLPGVQADGAGIWARLAQFHASEGFGALFVPEVGDEVVLGHVNDDPNHPVVLGSLYSSRRPPDALAAGSDGKAIVTRCGHRIEFNDGEQRLTISTPDRREIVLDDRDKRILMQDPTGNSVRLSQDGIALESPKDISIHSKGRISVQAEQGLSVNSRADLQLSGLNVHATAEVALTAKGGASAELSCAGQTIVKGAMVMIN